MASFIDTFLNFFASYDPSITRYSSISDRELLKNLKVKQIDILIENCNEIRNLVGPSVDFAFVKEDKLRQYDSRNSWPRKQGVIFVDPYKPQFTTPDVSLHNRLLDFPHYLPPVFAPFQSRFARLASNSVFAAVKEKSKSTKDLTDKDMTKTVEDICRSFMKMSK